MTRRSRVRPLGRNAKSNRKVKPSLSCQSLSFNRWVPVAKSRNYDRVASFYDFGAQLYSTGQIHRSKVAQLKHLSKGDRLLYAGVGTGQEAILAAKQGMAVTCIDISQKMIDRAKRRFEKSGVDGELLCGNVFDFERFEQYDAVLANYFLNCFVYEDMVETMVHTARMVRVGGLYMIADVALPQGNVFSRALNLAYLKSAMASYWIMGCVPWHENYDYAKDFPKANLEFVDAEHFRLAGVGPVVYQNTIGRKRASS